MKKITLLLVFLTTIFTGSYAQCIRPNLFGTIVSNNTGLPQTITTCAYTSAEYSVVSGLSVGEDYAFTGQTGTSPGLGTNNYLTITDTANNILMMGYSPLTITGITNDTVRIHYAIDEACTGTSTCNNATVTAILTCPIPLNVLLDGITTTTANFTWTLGGSETEWEVLILPNADPAPDSGTAGTVVSGTSAYFDSSLTEATAYKFYIRASCGGGEYSPWILGSSFTTSCVTVTDFSENFDASTNIPTCWSKVGTLGSVSVSSFNTGFSVPNNMALGSFNTTDLATVALPTLSNTAAATHQLKFKARSQYSWSIGGKVEVGYLTDITDASSFVMLESFTTTSGTVYDTFTANLGTQPQSQILAMRNPGTPPNAIVIDDVSWAPIPTASPSCATVSATPDVACGNFATVITWDAVDGVDGYNLSIGTTTGGTDIMDNEPIGDVTTYSFVGSFNTTYFYTVTPFNAFGSATGCLEQSFATFVDGCYCTSNPISVDGNGITNIQVGTTDFQNAAVTYTDHTATTVDLTQDVSTNLQISFDTSFYDYNTVIWIDGNNNLTFEEDEIVYTGLSQTPNPFVLDASFVLPASMPIGNHRMRIVATDSQQSPSNPCYNGLYGVTTDFSVNVGLLSSSVFDNKYFTYYPNPVKDVLNLSYTKNISNITVFNLLGQQITTKVVNANQSKIDMSNLASGTYLVKVTADNQVKTIKVIKR